MAAISSLKRSAFDDDIGHLSKKFRVLNPESDHQSAFSPKSSSFDFEETESVDTDLTHPSALKGDGRRTDAYQCPYDGCGKVYNRPCRLEDHIRSHTKEKPFLCSYEGCGKSFGRDTHLTRHIKSAHTDERKYMCDWEGCGKAFHTSQRLRVHQQVHENAEKFRCTEYPPCNQSFRKHKTLQVHITSVHLGKKPFQCSHIDEGTGKMCTHAYETQLKLDGHIRSVHGGERFFCTLCTEGDGRNYEKVGFKTFNALQTHIKEAHPPVCHDCSMAFSSHRELNSHIDLKHELTPLDERRDHICEECGKGFTKVGNLKVHINHVHRKQRKFVCNEADFRKSKFAELAAWDHSDACDQTFKTKQQLESHVRREHLGIESAWMAKKRQKLESGDVDVRKSTMFYPRPEPVPLMTALTGLGYEEQRPLACLRSNCKIRFLREYDLRQHCTSAHGMAEVEITEAICEREALSGGQFWIGGVEPGYEYDAAVNDEYMQWPVDPSLGQDVDMMAPQGVPRNAPEEDISMADAVRQFLQDGSA